MRYLIISLFLMANLTGNAQEDTSMYGYIDSTRFIQAEITPSFPGGEMRWKQYLANNLKYPTAAKMNRIQGVVIVEVTVTKDRTLSDIRVINPSDSSLAAEAMRLIKESRWVPAVEAGRSVNFRMRKEIEFKLE